VGEEAGVGELVTLEVAGGVGTIRLCHPPSNVLTLRLQDELTATAREAADRTDVAAVVVHGGGEVFASGGDIRELAGLSFGEMVLRARRIQGCFNAVAEIPKPVVAAVNGYALGGGCELALAADFRVAGERAVFGQPEVLLGLIPGGGATQRLPRLIGPARAKEMIFTGRSVRAAEGLAIGLVDGVVPDAQVYPAALERALSFVGGPSLALRAAKEAIDSGLYVDLATGLGIERTHFASLFATEDHRTGLESFVENGPGLARFAGA
jgi:enoyl-CoA hydratase